MRSTAAADWRGALPFERAMRLDAIVPGDDARCVSCGSGGAPRPRIELWAFKHRHPQHHDGWVRIYCDTHVPRPASPAAPARSSRAAVPRATPRRTPETVRVVCPDCFVEVPSSGICGVCGLMVTA